MLWVFCAILTVSVSLVSSHEYSHISLKQMEGTGTREFDLSKVVFKETGGKNCTKRGVMCDGCVTLCHCIELEEGTFLKLEIEDCVDGSSCLETPTTAYCTTGPNPECDDHYVFTCYQTGLFPDPFDCKKYHLCVPDAGEDNKVKPTSLPQYCDGGYHYDAKTTLCKKKLVDDICPVVIPACTALGQAGLVPNNPALYYVCLRQGSASVLYPNIFSCSNNKEYDLDTKSCVDTSPVSGLGPDGKCLEEGLFYDPGSCFDYYQCYFGGAMPISRSCSNRMHFDHKTQQCVEFNCADLNKN